MSDHIDRSEWFADKSTADLEAADVGKFFDLTANRIPEGFQDYYTAAAARGDTFVLNGGCKGLQVRLDSRCLPLWPISASQAEAELALPAGT